MSEPVTVQYEFASPPWMRALFDLIESRARASDLTGSDYSLCEVFSNVPEHLATSPDRTLAWHCVLRNGRVTCGMGDVENASWKVFADYGAMLPVARMIIGDGDDSAEKTERLIAALVREGKLTVQGTREGRPSFLEGLHDDMVRVTA